MPETPNDNYAYIRETKQEYLVVVNSEIKKRFSKFEDYALTEAKQYRSGLNAKS